MGGGESGMDPRDEFLQRVVGGKTFAEIGGLWGATQERVSVAHQFGATQLTMIDVLPPLNEWWKAFDQRMTDMGIADRVSTLSGDIMAMRVGPYDVTHSSGILYHLPSPIDYLIALYRITREYCVLTSAVHPTEISNRFGSVKLEPGQGFFVPAMSPQHKAIYAEFYTDGNDQVMLGGINRDTVFLPSNYVPWWWLLPPDTIAAMCRATGFEVVADAPNWAGKAHTFLLRNTGVCDVQPTG